MWVHSGDVWENLGDVPDGLGPALTEHHPRTRTEVLGVFDEAEETCGLVPRPQVLFVHRHDGGSLLGTATVYCTWDM